MADGRTVLNGVNWPDGTVTPVPGMYLGVQDDNTLQFYTLPTGSTTITGENGLTVTSGPTTTTIGLGDITPISVSTGNTTIGGNLNFTGNNRIISADFSNSIPTLRTTFKTSPSNSQTVIIARPSGTARAAGWEVENTSSGLGASGSVLFIGPTACGIQNYARTGGTYLPFYLLNGNEGLPDSPSFAGLVMDVFGNISIGGNRGLSVNATSRFLYLNSMPGTPTGTPMFPIGNTGPMSGKTAITVDVTNDKVYFRSNGLWRNTNTPDYQEFTATAGQTVFNTQIRTLAKTGIKSFLQIFVNGILQQEGSTKEYIVSGETQITFNNGIAVDADVVIYGFA